MNADNWAQPRARRLWLGAGWLLLVVLIVLAVQPMPVIVPMESGIDKVLHLLAFLVLMLWFCGLYPAEHYERIFLLLLFYGVAMEIAQEIAPDRLSEFADLVADIGGLVIGWLAALNGLAGWPRWIEQKVLRLD